MPMKLGSTPDQLAPTNLTGWWKASVRKQNSPKLMCTNHSVRTTAITLWSDAGVQNCCIMAISGHRSEQSLLHYNTQPWASQLPTCSEVLSRSVTSDRSESLAVTAINIKKEVQENSIVVSTATEKTTSGFGSLFNNCTIQNVQVTLGSNFSHTCWHLLSHCFQCLLNGLFSVIDILCEAFWLVLTLWSNFLRTIHVANCTCMFSSLYLREFCI